MSSPRSYSLLGPMNTRPYAIGERPGGSDIPSIPLLSGKDAWDSLSGYYTPRRLDSQMQFGAPPVPTRSTDVQYKGTKKAGLVGLYKEARGAGALTRTLGKLFSRKPATTTLPTNRPAFDRDAYNMLSGNWSRLRPPTPPRPTPSPSANSLMPRELRPGYTPPPPAAAPRPGLLERARGRLPSTRQMATTGGVAAAGTAGVAGAHMLGQEYGPAAGEAAYEGATNLADTVSSAFSGGETAAAPAEAPTGDAKPPALPEPNDATKWLGKNWHYVAGGGLGLAGLVGLYNAYRQSKEDEEEEDMYRQLHLKTASARSLSRVRTECPRVAGFLQKCGEAQMPELAIRDAMVKAAEADPEFKAELDKIAYVPVGSEKLAGLGSDMFGNARRLNRGLWSSLGGGVGTVLGGAANLGSKAYNSSADFVNSTANSANAAMGGSKNYWSKPKHIPTEATGQFTQDSMDMSRAGLSDMGKSLGVGGLNETSTQYNKTPVNQRSGVLQQMDTMAGREGVPEGTREQMGKVMNVAEVAGGGAALAQAAPYVYATGQAAAPAVGQAARVAVNNPVTRNAIAKPLGYLAKNKMNTAIAGSVLGPAALGVYDSQVTQPANAAAHAEHVAKIQETGLQPPSEQVGAAGQQYYDDRLNQVVSHIQTDPQYPTDEARAQAVEQAKAQVLTETNGWMANMQKQIDAEQGQQTPPPGFMGGDQGTAGDGGQPAGPGAAEQMLGDGARAVGEGIAGASAAIPGAIDQATGAIVDFAGNPVQSVEQAGKFVQDASKQIGGKLSELAQTAPEQVEKFKAGLAQGGPVDPETVQGTAQRLVEQGVPEEQAVQQAEGLGWGEHAAIWGGIAVAALGLMATMSGEGGLDTLVLSLLGGGAALAGAAHGGVLGDDAQQLVQGGMGTVTDWLGLGGGGAPAPGAEGATQGAPPGSPPAQGAVASDGAVAAGGAAAPTNFAAALTDPKQRQALMAMPDAELIPQLKAAAQADPELAGQLAAIKQNPRLAPMVLQTPVGQSKFGKPGLGLSPQEAQRLVQIATQM